MNPINTHGHPTLAGLHGRSYIIIYILYVERLDLFFVIAHALYHVNGHGCLSWAVEYNM